MAFLTLVHRTEKITANRHLVFNSKKKCSYFLLRFPRSKCDVAFLVVFNAIRSAFSASPSGHQKIRCFSFFYEG